MLIPPLALYNPGKFHGILKMQIKNRAWEDKPKLYLNTMIHELGHALGIPHLPSDKTEIMNSAGHSNRCNKNKKECDITWYDFERFLHHYHKRPRVYYRVPEYYGCPGDKTGKMHCHPI